jgi:hypothetical protein
LSTPTTATDAAATAVHRFAALPAAEIAEISRLLALLEATPGIIPDVFLLHRMMLQPTFGPGKTRVDMTVTAAGKVIGGGVSTSIHLPDSLSKETHDFMFASARAPRDTGCFCFRPSLARSLGFHVSIDSVLLGSDAGEHIILHVTLTPPFGTLQSTVRDWLSRIAQDSVGNICACKAAGEPEHLCEEGDDGSLPPAGSLPWSPLAAASLLPAACHTVTGPLSDSASFSAVKLLHADGDCSVDAVT